MMKTLVMTVLLLLSAWLSAGYAEERKIIAYPPPKFRYPDGDTSLPGPVMRQIMSRFLLERLGQAPGVQLVDDGRHEALLSLLDASVMVDSGKGIDFALYRSLLKADAVLEFAVRENEFELRLHQAAGSSRLKFKLDEEMSGILNKTDAFLIENLGLKLRPAAFAAADGDMLRACYLGYSLWWGWPGHNAGEKQIDRLRRYSDKAPTSQTLVEAVMHAGFFLSFDGLPPVLKPQAVIVPFLNVLPFAFGTRSEQTARDFIRINKYAREVVEAELLDIVKKSCVSVEDSLLEGGGADAVAEIGALGESEASGNIQAMKPERLGGFDPAKMTLAQRCGAVRCLGASNSQKAIPLLQKVAQSKEPELRIAVAFALGQYRHTVSWDYNGPNYSTDAGIEDLTRLLADPSADVACQAAHSLWLRGRKAAGIAEAAHRALAGGKSPLTGEALELLAELGTPQDEALVRPHLTSSGRASALRFLLRTGLATAKEAEAGLNDVSPDVVVTALGLLPPEMLPDLREQLLNLARVPYPPIVDALQAPLQKLRPASGSAARRFDLATVPIYIRFRNLESLAADGGAEAVSDLVAATENPEPHVRARALMMLAEKHPDKVAPCLGRLLGDPYRWVLLHAAAVASRLADRSHTEAIRQALAKELDPAARLYLEDALAKAQGLPLPPPPPKANALSSEKARFGRCNHGADAASTPETFYYDLTYTPDEATAAAHTRGKAFLARSNKTTKNPSEVLTSRTWLDSFWIELDREFGDTASLDGIVLGEESMSMGASWEQVWRLFCYDAQLDPKQIAGDIGKLDPVQQRAWQDWTRRISIKGFNYIYDYIKLRYGKLHPGFQVATFMTSQAGTADYDPAWKFDVGCGYNYSDNPGDAYDYVRYIKTLWPDRQAVWLPRGRVNTPMYVDLRVSDSTAITDCPRVLPESANYVDSVATWLAGGHPCTFAIWFFANPRVTTSGDYVTLTDLCPPGSKQFDTGMDRIYSQTAAKTRTEKLKQETAALQPSLRMDAADDPKLAAFELDEPIPSKDPLDEAVEKSKARRRQLMLLEGKLVLDCARFLNGMPMPGQAPEVLSCGGGAARAQVFRCDCVGTINHLAAINLNKYRLIMVGGGSEARLTDATIEAVSRWLTESNGLLYVSGALAHDNSLEASTVDDLDGRLRRDWPWEGEVEPVLAAAATNSAGPRSVRTYTVTGASATVLRGTKERPEMVWWRGKGLKGGVLFSLEGTNTPAAEIRKAIDDLHQKQGVGLALNATAVALEGAADGLRGVLNGKASDRKITGAEGVDALTGAAGTFPTNACWGFVSAGRYLGEFWAANAGVTVLGATKLQDLEAIDRGLRLRCGGLVQMASVAGAPEVTVEDGKALPAIEEKDFLSWMLLSDKPGRYAVRLDDTGRQMVFARSPGVIRVCRPAGK